MEILLIEDDVVDAKTVRRVFDSRGVPHTLRVMGGAGEALDWLRGPGTGAAARPGLILLDLNMPGMSGLDFLAVVKDDDDLRTIPVIVLSTSDLESDVRACYRSGVAGYFVKPLEYGRFADTLESILHYWELCQHPQNRAAIPP